MSDDDPRKPRAPGTAVSPPADTSTDWDEWMERHADRPAPVADVADAQGRFRPVGAPAQEGAAAAQGQRGAVRKRARKPAGRSR